MTDNRVFVPRANPFAHPQDVRAAIDRGRYRRETEAAALRAAPARPRLVPRPRTAVRAAQPPSARLVTADRAVAVYDAALSPAARAAVTYGVLAVRGDGTDAWVASQLRKRAAYYVRVGAAAGLSVRAAFQRWWPTAPDWIRSEYEPDPKAA